MLLLLLLPAPNARPPTRLLRAGVRPPRPAAHTHTRSACLRCTATAAMRETPSKGPMAPTTVHLEPHDGHRALEGISTLILDCDGVLWRGNDVIPGTREALAELRRLGKRLLFVTNNSSKSRAQYVSKFASLGIQAEAHEIVPASFAAAAYLQSIGFAGEAFLVGGEGCEQELQAAGIPYSTLPPSSGISWTVESFRDMQLQQGIGAVVVGFDEDFSYEKLCFASACLREIPDCHFVCTNLDNADHIGNGRMMPGTGCIVSAIETATSRRAFNVGKGGTWLLPFLCGQYGVQPHEACIVGDRLDTDIALGKAGGLRTVLPLTGVTTLDDLRAADPDSAPDFVVPSFGALLGF